MGEDSEQYTNAEQQTVQPISNERILYLMAAVIVLGTILSLFFVSRNFGIGVFIGGVLSLINFYWLKRSLKSIFANAVEGEKPRLLATKYFLRYLAFGIILAIVYLTKSVSVVAVLLGLSSFAFAIIIEAILRLFSGFFNKKEV